MKKNRKPNVVLVITDDQGYGDLGCTGNPWIRTPNLDRFHGDSLRLADFHAHPLCTPTRGALMTGRRPIRNGAWATCWGRSILRATETTLADVFAANGYRTALFGKWHLGDNTPYRPFERGFQHVVAHKGGGVGQLPDFWGNNYFDDTYFHNGRPRGHEGYCTDVWFREAERFIEEAGDDPFFAVISTNAPHAPYFVADRYADPYRDKPEIPSPEFYGMIANIDENFGRLEARLREWKLADDTILIFMTDNGSSGGCELKDGFCVRGYNAGMRGKKASYYEGGHRVPFFVRWPAGNLGGGRDVADLCLDIDLLPSLADLCGLSFSRPLELDGVSFANRLRDPDGPALPDRLHVLQIRQSTEPPEPWNHCVLTAEWRLVHGRELYSIRSDPGQRRDLAADRPDVAARLLDGHRRWWDSVQEEMNDICALPLGRDAENPACLCAMDVLGDVAWQQAHAVAAVKHSGTWCVEVDRPGSYRFELRRWPREFPAPFTGNVSKEFAARMVHPGGPRVSWIPERARIRIFDAVAETPVDPEAGAAVLDVEIGQTGKTRLDAGFTDAAGNAQGAFYVYVTRR